MQKPVTRSTSYVRGPSSLSIPLSANEKLRFKLATIKANLLLHGLTTSGAIREKAAKRRTP